MSPSKHFTIKVGESAKVHSRFFASYAIVYAGMPTDASYSIVVAWTCGYNSLAYNLFFPAGQKEFQAARGRVTVQRVSPEEIEILYQA